MYAKITGQTVVKFPYTFNHLKTDFPNVSFPKDITVIDLAAWGVAEVIQQADPSYNPATERLEQGVPVYGQPWTVTQVVTPLTQQEQDDYAAGVIRAEDRAAILADTEVVNFLKSRPAQINNYIDTNVNDMAGAKALLKIMARAQAVLAQTLLR